MTTTIGAYTVTERLSGEGEVYLATSADGRRCLLRMLAVPSTDDRVERVRAETLACAALAHPAVGVVNDVIAEGDRTGIVCQEPLDGTNLSELIHKLRQAGKKLGPTAVWHLGHQVAAALALAHSSEVDGDVMSISHGHLSPEQVAISWDGGVRLEGLGLGPLVGLGGLRPQPGYQAPEEAAGGRITPRGDIYSLAAMLWTLLSGKDPHEGMGVADLEGVPGSFEDPFARALEPKLAKRRITSTELEQYLDEMRGDQGKKVLVEAVGLLRKGSTLLGIERLPDKPPQLGRVTHPPPIAPKMPPLRARQATLVGGGPRAGVDWGAAVEAATSKPSKPPKHDIAEELSWGGDADDTTQLPAFAQLEKTGEETTDVTSRRALEREIVDEDSDDVTELRMKIDLESVQAAAAKRIERAAAKEVAVPAAAESAPTTIRSGTAVLGRPMASSRRALSRPGIGAQKTPSPSAPGAPSPSAPGAPPSEREPATEPMLPSIPDAGLRPSSPRASTPRPASSPEIEVHQPEREPESLSALVPDSTEQEVPAVGLAKTLVSMEEPVSSEAQAKAPPKIEDEEAAPEPRAPLPELDKTVPAEPPAVKLPPAEKPVAAEPVPEPAPAPRVTPSGRPSPWSPEPTEQAATAVSGEKPIPVAWSIVITIATAVVVMILGVLWVRRNSTVNSVPSAEPVGSVPSASASAAPSGRAAPPGTSPEPGPAPSGTQGALVPPDLDATKLPPNMGYLVVEFNGPADADVVAFGKSIGKVNRPIETQCRATFVRVRAADGVAWLTEGKPAVVKCRDTVKVPLTPSK